MKPKPFSPLNHFTVPVAMFVPSFLCPDEPDRCSGAIGPWTERELHMELRS
jgi:hypothetical protein